MFMIIVALIAVLSSLLVTHKTYWGIIQAIEYTKYSGLKLATIVITSTIAGTATLVIILSLGSLINQVTR